MSNNNEHGTVATDSKTRSADVGISFPGMVNRLALTCKRSIVSMAWRPVSAGFRGQRTRANSSTTSGRKTPASSTRRLTAHASDRLKSFLAILIDRVAAKGVAGRQPGRPNKKAALVNE